jgi:hypothetical protein
MPARDIIAFESLYRRLLVADMQNRLPGVANSEPEQIDEEECARLMGHASLLALSAIASDRSASYEIATRVSALCRERSPALLQAADFILGRLGNFPGRSLLRVRYASTLRTDSNSSPYLHLEVLAREVENTVEDAAGEQRALTDFQFDTLEAFNEWKSVSVSAPTSAGKSFILSLEVIRKLRKSKQPCIVYLVPTRALIRQVVLTLRDDLTKAGLSDVPVRSVPLPISRDNAPKGLVYVLTQERLLSLLHSDDGEVWITTLIVDEAQGIGDGSRGVLLHTAIDEIVRRFRDADVFFASPMARNPEYLLKIFHREGGKPSVEQHSPVSQNLLLVERGGNGGNSVSFKLFINGNPVAVGERELPFSVGSDGILSRRAKFALAVGAKEGCCIVYANGARDAEKIAEELARSLPEKAELSPAVLEFISFLEDHVHREYGLIHVLRRGVAFHYSNMPGSVRAGVEELGKGGHLGFICCTSTLLQGVNLPARDIVVENPKRGMGKPMKRSDFVNLAGRAGRLLREFHGNVWCLRPDLWEEKCFVGEPLQEIESAYERCLGDGGTAVRRVFDEDASLGDWDRDTAVATFTRIYTDFVIPGRSLLTSEYRTPENEQSLAETMDKLQGIRTSLPPEVFFKNQGVLPMRLEDLFQTLLSAEDPRVLMPIAPFIMGTNHRLFKIFETVERLLQQDQTNRFKYYWQLSKEWLHQRHLNQIISDRITYLLGVGGEVNVRNTIYEVIEDLEKVVRYRFVKHLRAYNDVLRVVLQRRGFSEEADALVPMHLFLECGAADPVALGLISIGLSRTSALLLKARIRFPRDSSPEECLHILNRINFATISLPAFCKHEVVSLVRGRQI